MADKFAYFTYPVVEIFDSIQGEGTFMGKPVTFIRLGGCNLNCEWCDTKFDKFTQMTAKDIVKRVNYQNVVITGGEPTIHNLIPLLTELKHSYRRHVAIETNGTNSTTEIRDLVDWIVCSPKPQTKWRKHDLCQADEIKYVVDGEFNPDKIPIGILASYQNRIWLQPESSDMDNRFKEAYEYAMKYPYLRVGIQLHKILEVR